MFLIGALMTTNLWKEEYKQGKQQQVVIARKQTEKEEGKETEGGGEGCRWGGVVIRSSGNYIVCIYGLITYEY